jgi:hypothetical protein
MGTALRVDVEVSGLGTSNTGEAEDDTEGTSAAAPDAAGAALALHWVTLSSDQHFTFFLGTGRTTESQSVEDYASVVLNPQALNLRYDGQFSRRPRQYARARDGKLQSPFSYGFHPTVGATQVSWERAATDAVDGISTSFWMMDFTLAALGRYDLSIKDGGSSAPWAVLDYAKKGAADISVRLEPGVTVRTAVGGEKAPFNRALGLEVEASRVYVGPSVTFGAQLNQVDFFATYTRFAKGERRDVVGLTGSQIFLGARVTGMLYNVLEMDEDEVRAALMQDVSRFFAAKEKRKNRRQARREKRASKG